MLPSLVGADVPASAVGADTVAARVTITVQVGASGKGTFKLVGGPSDSGRVVVIHSSAGLGTLAGPLPQA